MPQLPYRFAKLCLAQSIEDAQAIKSFRITVTGPSLEMPASDWQRMKGRKATTLTIYTGVENLEFKVEGDYQFETYLNDDDKPTITKSFSVKVDSTLRPRR